MPYQILALLLEHFGLLIDLIRFFLRIDKILMPLIHHIHILFHNIMYTFQFFLHPVHILHRVGIIKLFLLLLDNPIKSHKIMTTLDILNPRLDITGP